VKKLNHLAEIYKDYDTYLIDLWGVIHNGVRLNLKAIEVVENQAGKLKNFCKN
jgi:ribonucleotide monophosphatase NagD (HAD superfamily)